MEATKEVDGRRIAGPKKARTDQFIKSLMLFDIGISLTLSIFVTATEDTGFCLWISTYPGKDKSSSATLGQGG